MLTFLKGFGLGFSLILAIGAQNAFILRMGLERQHVFWLCLFAAVSDAVLIALGVGGVGRLLAPMADASFWLYVLAAGWLTLYGVLRLKDAWSGASALEASNKVAGRKPMTLAAALLMVAGLTWLNPHVYLDTVVLLGGISATLPEGDKLNFGVGAALSSFTFFFGLGYGASWMGRYLKDANVWIKIDIGIAVVMFWIAAGLIISAFNG